MIGTFTVTVRRLVVAADGADQRARGALALQVGVVMREVFHGERHVGVAQERLVLVAVRVEGAGDERRGPTTSRTRRASSASGRGTPRAAMAPCTAEIDAVERARRRSSSIIRADEGLERLLGDPAGPGAGLRETAATSMPTSSTPSNSRATLTKPPM